MAKIVCVLYDDPVDGYPKSYARDDLPKLDTLSWRTERCRRRRRSISSRARCSAASPANWACANSSKSNGHSFVVTSDKDGANSRFERELADAEIVISQPFWPAYLTNERIAKAKKLKLAITAGIGSDHVDLASGDAIAGLRWRRSPTAIPSASPSTW